MTGTVHGAEYAEETSWKVASLIEKNQEIIKQSINNKIIGYNQYCAGGVEETDEVQSDLMATLEGTVEERHSEEIKLS